ncbi:MAG: sugar phosphate isomerase/epimerase [Chloroflexi bacterium]|nr:sugar phosphate isomerase/epimerase [Chloroflexota bacterium]
MDSIVVHHTMTVLEWVELASQLDIQGLELYGGFFPENDTSLAVAVRNRMRELGLAMPMLCVSPDFTHPDPAVRLAEVERERRMIDFVASFESPLPRTCRVLSGQRRPDVSVKQGVAWVIECIEALLPYAEQHQVILALENHYKDNFWLHPEFAQHLSVFRQIVDRIDSPWFGVNYDPSNAFLAGEDPLEVLEAVKLKVVSMHASDRYLLPGYSVADLRTQEDHVGYARILQHGEIGRGLNDYDAIFHVLAESNFAGWISIEDGVNGFDELERSVAFLSVKIRQYFGGA